MPFAFRSQPLKLLYFIYTGVALLFIRLPIWLFTSLLPSWRPRPSWSIKRTLIVRSLGFVIAAAYNTAFPPADELEKLAESAKHDGFVWIDATPDLIVGEIREMAALNSVKPARTAGFWFGAAAPDGKVDRKASPGERVTYYIHGGGFIVGTANPKHPNIFLIYDILSKACPNARVFGVEYRLASTIPFTVSNPWPAGLLDCIAGYNYLVQTMGFHPNDIVVSGDSAGGTLGHALVLYLTTNKLPNLSPPQGLILVSPTVDLAATHDAPDSSMNRNSRSDYVHAIFTSGYNLRALMGNLPLDDAKTSAWISPGSLQLPNPRGLFTGFPKTFILSGNAEMTLDAMRTMRDRMIADLGDGQVTYVEWPDATHNFLIYSWHEPERTAALPVLEAWFSSL